MQKEYVTPVEGAYLVGDTARVPHFLIYLSREGMSAESMVECFPAFPLEQVHGALTFYLGNQREIDAYLMEALRTAESQHRQSRQTTPN